MLLAKSAHPHLNGGVTAVHVVFDSSGLLLETTKEIEHKRRDNTTYLRIRVFTSPVNSLFQAHGGEYFLVEHAREPHTT